MPSRSSGPTCSSLCSPHSTCRGRSPMMVAPLRRWAEMLASPQADKLKEKELLPDFLTDVFCGVLGYTRAVDNKDRFTFSREKHVQVDGKFADAVLGDFRARQRAVRRRRRGQGAERPARPAVRRPQDVGGRSGLPLRHQPAVRLDHRHLDPADAALPQGLRPAHLRAVRHRDAGRATTALLKRFVFLLGAERVVPRTGQVPLLRSARRLGAGRPGADQGVLRPLRRHAARRLRAALPGQSRRRTARTCCQRRRSSSTACCSAAFCEDRGLLPAETISQAYEHADPYNPRPVWDNFRGLFRAVNSGNPALSIPAYNGGLFADDPVLDRLTVPDEVCGYFRDLAAYDYRPGVPGQPTTSGQAGGKLVDVDILGHIFEQSITDLERTARTSSTGRSRAARRDERRAAAARRRGRSTPRPSSPATSSGRPWAACCSERFEPLRQQHAEEAARARPAASSPTRAPTTRPAQRAAAGGPDRFWEAWQDELGSVRCSTRPAAAAPSSSRRSTSSTPPTSSQRPAGGAARPRGRCSTSTGRSSRTTSTAWT